MKVTRTLAAFVGLPLFASTLFAQDEERDWVVQADVLYTAAGDPIEGGVVVLADGKIAAVGTSGGGGGETLRVAAVTPGLIDLAARIDTGAFSVEQTTEAELTASISDALDLFSYRWGAVLRGGVTTVLATPDDWNVLGGLCSVVKTAGGFDGRELKSEVALRASLGTQPSAGNNTPSAFAEASIYTRRPTTRMGVEWVFRKTFYDAINAERFELEVDAAQAARNAVVGRTLAGELPVVVKTMATQDVRTAIYLKEEFGIPHMILDEAAEAWKEPALVERSGVSVILPPYPTSGRLRDPYANDTYFMALDSAARFHALGVPVALSSHGSSAAESRLANQAGLAMRGGLSHAAALAAVTIDPARMVGVDDRVGSIEVGKDADLVLWSGTPFEPTSGVVGVIVDGVLVLDPRPADEDAR